MTEWASNLSADGDEAAAKQPRAAGTISFEDGALVEQSKRGDMQAFGSLVAKYQDRVINTVYRICGNRSDAEELAQEAFLKALRKIGGFRGQSGFYTWLFRIAVNLAISHRRRAGRVRFQSMTRSDEFDGAQAHGLTAETARRRDPSPEAQMMAADTCRKVQEALMDLDDEHRLVVVLRDMEDMDYAQIAQVLEAPVGTVKSRLHRARSILKDKLADLIG